MTNELPGSFNVGNIKSAPVFFASILAGLKLIFPVILFTLYKFGNSIEPVSALYKSVLDERLDVCFLILIKEISSK